jgi:hypothetical protein
VAGGDGSDDGQPEAVTVLVVRAARIEALEWSEKAIDFTRRNDRTRVGYSEHRSAILGIGR